LNKTVEEAQVATISKEVLQLLIDLREPLETLDKVATNLDSILDKEVQQSLKDLSQTLENVKTTSGEFPETVAELNKTLRQVRRFTSAQEQDIGVTLENIRLISEDLKVFLDTAKRYPSWTLFGNPPPRLDEVKK
jgi:ABC-type transporter Mla subunit MlaD